MQTVQNRYQDKLKPVHRLYLKPGVVASRRNQPYSVEQLSYEDSRRLRAGEALQQLALTAEAAPEDPEEVRQLRLRVEGLERQLAEERTAAKLETAHLAAHYEGLVRVKEATIADYVQDLVKLREQLHEAGIQNAELASLHPVHTSQEYKAMQDREARYLKDLRG